jgi:hypothetical protein
VLECVFCQEVKDFYIYVVIFVYIRYVRSSQHKDISYSVNYLCSFVIVQGVSLVCLWASYELRCLYTAHDTRWNYSCIMKTVPTLWVMFFCHRTGSIFSVSLSFLWIKMSVHCSRHTMKLHLYNEDSSYSVSYLCSFVIVQGVSLACLWASYALRCPFTAHDTRWNYTCIIKHWWYMISHQIRCCHGTRYYM